MGEYKMTKQKNILSGYIASEKLPSLTRDNLRKLTHLNITFAHIQNGVLTIEHMQYLECLAVIKRKYPRLNILLSVGGWGAGGFSEAAATEAARKRLANSALQILCDYPFDGIDLDWEYPCYGEAGIASTPNDKTNFTLLLKTFREVMNRKGQREGRHYLLSIAVGADQYYIDGTEMEQVSRYVDYVQLMTYDMRGGFQTLTGHHTNLYTPTGDLFRISIDTSVSMYIRAGVPKEKIVIGVAFYSRIWHGVPNRNNGLHQNAESTGGYGPNYTQLVSDYINKNGYVRYWDDEAKAPYLYNGNSFISYDDKQSIGYKCDYVKQRNLAGIMFWEYN